MKALACELPSEKGVPLSRWSSADIAREAVDRGIVAKISGATVWRWLSEDAIRPWNYRSWIFPRDPDFARKAGRILDLYEGRWEGQLLEPGDFVVCADEKPSIQARRRKARTLPATAGDGQKVEHEYERMGRALLPGSLPSCSTAARARTGSSRSASSSSSSCRWSPTPRRSASSDRRQRSAHRRQRSIDRLGGAWPNLIVVHTPIHASWLNQAEIYFSIVQRKALEPNDFEDLDALERHLLAFGRHYEQIARPFEWKFTRRDLDRLLHRLDQTPERRLELRAA